MYYDRDHEIYCSSADLKEEFDNSAELQENYTSFSAWIEEITGKNGTLEKVPNTDDIANEIGSIIKALHKINQMCEQSSELSDIVARYYPFTASLDETIFDCISWKASIS